MIIKLGLVDLRRCAGTAVAFAADAIAVMLVLMVMVLMRWNCGGGEKLEDWDARQNFQGSRWLAWSFKRRALKFVSDGRIFASSAVDDRDGH